MGLPNFNDAEVDAIVAEVESQLRTTATRLAKAIPEETPGEGPPGSPEASPGGGAPPPPSSTMPDAGGSTTPPESSSPPASPEGEGAPGEGAPGEGAPGEGEAPASVEELTQAYSELPPEELKNHFIAIKAAIEQVLGAGGGGGAGRPGAAPAGPPPGAMPPPAAKAEVSPSLGSGGQRPSPSPGSGGQRSVVSKSELDLLKEEVAFLKKSQGEKDELFTKLENGLARIAGKPERKAVTSVSAVAKPGAQVQGELIKMSREQAIERLSKKAADPKLTSEKREMINKFTVGAVDINAVADLLKD